MLEQIPENANQCDLQFMRSGEADSQWQLPDQDQVKAWKRERDEIEEQVLEFDGGDLKRMKKMTRGELYKGVDMPSSADKSASGYITSPDTAIDTPRVHHSRPYRLDRPYLIFITAARPDPRFGDASTSMGSGSVAGDE